MLASRARIDVYHGHLAYSRESCEMEDRLADRQTGQGKAGQKISERNPKALWALRQSRCSAAFLFSFPYP
ncbi:uncharacterized protein ARB_04234 [Trichophyton benhamiae CBS 112371]|uniref:Uncharacterized protein n=1 Tax=Arthroderma benhamiae (strain ATCC MYA-4681 / CBS 112371) TaxID=663331 RepID=D4AIY6_ARTBC|nr:uncharacterized protein ARB_04234 [Trichophyton benhamiae CBS 112371]EFE36709.1 hypothetical protein ARB_04234 [Trichophyton benhamiae CBS 112371]